MLAIFAFAELMLVAKIFGNHRRIEIGIVIYKWIYFTWFCIMFVTIITLVGVYGDALYKIREFNIPLVEYIAAINRFVAIAKTVSFLLVFNQTFLFFTSTPLLIWIVVVLSGQTSLEDIRKQKHVKNIWVRAFFLVLASVMVLLYFPVIIYTILYFYSWHGGVLPNSWGTEYQTTYAGEWFSFLQSAVEFIWITFIALAMRTVAKSWIYRRIAQIGLFSGVTATESSSKSKTGIGSEKSGIATTTQNDLSVKNV